MTLLAISSINLLRDSAMAHATESYPGTVPPPYASASAANASVQMRANMGSALDNSRTLAGMLLAAFIAALLVVADQLIETWTDGHLLATWVALWIVAFATLALLATPLRQIASFVAGGFVSYLAQRQQQREEDRMWEAASHDPRVMEDIRAAMLRSETAV